MVAARASRSVSASQEFEFDDLRKWSSWNSPSSLTRSSHIRSDSLPDFGSVDPPALDGCTGDGLIRELQRPVVVQATSALKDVIQPLSVRHSRRRETIKRQAFSSFGNDAPLLNDSTSSIPRLTNPNTKDPSIEDSGERDNVTLKSFLLRDLSTQASRSRTGRTHDQDLQLEADHGTSQTLGRDAYPPKKVNEAAQSTTGSEDHQILNSKMENTSRKPLLLNTQSPAATSENAQRRSIKDYHDALTGIDTESVLASTSSQASLDDGLSQSIPEPSNAHAGSIALSLKIEEIAGIYGPEGTVTTTSISAFPSHLSMIDGAATENSGRRHAASSRLQQPGRRQSLSSESNISIPLRMEEEECPSFRYSLDPDAASLQGTEKTPRPSPSLQIDTPGGSHKETSELFLSPSARYASPTRVNSWVAKNSSTNHARWRREEGQKLTSQLLLRRHCTDKFELGHNHPANRIFARFPAGVGHSGDANDPDPDDSAWTAVPPQTACGQGPSQARPGRGDHGADEALELQNMEADDKVPDRPVERPTRQGNSLRNRPQRPFNLSKARKRAPIARDWSTGRKRFVASVACISTALMGVVIGIYAGETPAIQYAIVDQNHQVILGNVVFFLGLVIPTAFLYPLPLLHGRKPYTLAALALLLPFQFPPAVIVSQQRSPNVKLYRVGLLLSRGLAGVAMGFATSNFLGTLLDLFGASLMSSNPHQETLIEHDPRRHGGGMGIWLGIWTWCFLGSIGLGFVVGALIISGLNVAWGFWIIIVTSVVVLILNVIAPEVRRSAYRRSMAEVRDGSEVSRRVARGEIMMHLYSTGPLHWWEEVLAGITLNGRMLKQPGFLIMAVYIGWMFAQVVLVIILLGALTSRYYRFQPQTVAFCVASMPLGALLAIPFQKASLFSRSRQRPQRTDSMTFEKRFTWTSHLVRRTIFMTCLPLAGVAYTLASGGPPMPVAVPSVLAGLVGFLSSLALSECVGMIMETFDVSDLQPGMTGRRRSVVPEAELRRRANYSCFPRVVSGLACSQAIAFLLAAGATAWAGNVERAVGAQVATGIVAGILFVVTLALVAALTRLKSVQVVPRNRLDSVALRGPGEDLPVIIGHPSGIDRRVSWLELGRLTRWAEIRRRNRLAS